MKLSEYILLSQEERMAHLDASAPCILVERNRWTRMRFELLAQFGIENDIDSWRGKISRCHKCESHLSAGNTQICINPCHWYWGTPKENTHDMPREHLQRGGYATKGVKHSRPKSAEHRRKLSIAQSKYQQKLRDEKAASS